MRETGHREDNTVYGELKPINRTQNLVNGINETLTSNQLINLGAACCKSIAWMSKCDGVVAGGKPHENDGHFRMFHMKSNLAKQLPLAWSSHV